MAESTKLDSLPQDVMERILQHVFPVDRTVRPWFNMGKLTLGIRGWSKNDDGVATEPNLDVSFLRLNKACYEVGTKILYGTNDFRFAERPDCCRWWLDRIGFHNIRKIKTMTFIMRSGWLADRRDRAVLPSQNENSFEEDWAKSLAHIRRCDARLDRLNVATLYWNDLSEDKEYDEDSKEELDFWRRSVVYRLTQFRGIRKVFIREIGHEWIGADALRIQLMMQQPALPAQEKTTQPELTLTQLIARCRAEREARERREADEARAREREANACWGNYGDDKDENGDATINMNDDQEM